MLSWKIEEGIISSLKMREAEQLINPWGIETADSWGFFSLEKNIGYRHFRTDKDTHREIKKSQLNLEVEMPEGHWIMRVADQLTEKSVIRTVNLNTLKESWFMDFVMRFRFKKKYFDYAEIADKKIIHANSNVYHQYPVNEAWLKGKKYNVHLQVQDLIHGDEFAPFLYVRDYQDEWIIHIRFLPLKTEKTIIKLCNGWCKTKPLSPFLNQELLKKIWIRNQLLYRSERKPYENKLMRVLCPNAFPLVSLPANKNLLIKAECTIYES